MYKMMILWTIALAASVIITAHAEHHNGRLDMCKELGGNYLITDECVKSIELKEFYNPNLDPKKLNISVNNIIGGDT